MVRPMIVFTFWLGGMEDRSQLGFSGLTEIGNQRLKFRDADVAGVCGAGLLVLCRKGAMQKRSTRNLWRNLLVIG